MSLVTPVDSSATSYCESRLYAGKNGNGMTNTNLTMTDKKMYNYSHPSYHPYMNDQQYFSNDTLVSMKHVEFLQCSQTGTSGSLYQNQIYPVPYQLICDSRSSATAQNRHANCLPSRQSDSPVSSISHQASSSTSDIQSPDNDVFCVRSDIRCSLQEIERKLLDDSDEDLLDESDDMGIDDDWFAPIKNLMLPTSPRESLSNILIDTSPKESSSYLNINSAESIKESRTPKHMLFDCAAAISDGNNEKAFQLITELRPLVSVQGDPSQRLAAYLVEGLVARTASSGQDIYKSLRCKEPPTSDRLSAMQILFEACPCFKFGILAANGAISDTIKGEKNVHIVDFDINQGGQYITLMQALSKRITKPRLRITAVDDPETVQRSVGGLKFIGLCLEEFSKEHNIPFEFRAIAAKTGDITPLMLACRSDEELIVNFAYQLHHMPDESVSVLNQRDQLLRMVKGLEPKLVTVVEQDINTNTAPFFPRFLEVYNYYLAIFESLDYTIPRDSPDRMNVERECLAKDIVNIVACDGTDRIERYEAAGKWRMRMNMAGFVSSPISSSVHEAIQTEVKGYSDRYMVKEEAGSLYFGWEDKILVVASAWK